MKAAAVYKTAVCLAGLFCLHDFRKYTHARSLCSHEQFVSHTISNVPADVDNKMLKAEPQPTNPNQLRLLLVPNTHAPRAYVYSLKLRTTPVASNAPVQPYRSHLPHPLETKRNLPLSSLLVCWERVRRQAISRSNSQGPPHQQNCQVQTSRIRGQYWLSVRFCLSVPRTSIPPLTQHIYGVYAKLGLITPTPTHDIQCKRKSKAKSTATQAKEY